MRSSVQPGGLAWHVVMAVHRLRDNAYGVSIREGVAERMQRQISYGAIYTTLSRLERDGLLRSWEGDPSAERGGRAKRFYALTGRGAQIMQTSFQQIESLRQVALQQGALA